MNEQNKQYKLDTKVYTNIRYQAKGGVATLIKNKLQNNWQQN